jgi:class 3 adenylate cyclase/tetratricopeptide (TPR) repeat protein
MAEMRKIVTIVFADISGSTRLGEELDAEVLRRVMERYFEEMRSILEHHGGTVEKFIGDAVMAAFGIPVAHEDDALRAIRAAVDMRVLLSDLNEELARERGMTLAVRTGINTGEVVVGDPAEGHFYASGDAVNVAARLEQAARPGEILLGEQTYRLVRDAVSVGTPEPLTLKGKSDAVPAYRLLEVVEGAPALARRFDTPFVGREEELAHLLACLERAVTKRTPVLVTVLGPPGIGKTRLAAELTTQIGERATVLRGRCLSYGEGITFWPLQEILRSLRTLPSGVANPNEAGSTEDTFLAYRKLFEALAAEHPLLLVLEDIHWAEPTLLDLIEHITEWTREAPLLIVCLARPELLDERPGWRGELFDLHPLADGATRSLVAALAAGIDPALQDRSAKVAEGNPLFLEQLLALAAEEQGRKLAVPDTIHALLSARLDQLAPEERALLERASVVGKEFWRSALAYLSPPHTEVSALLQGLVRRRLIRPERSSLPGEDAFRFGHILIRDAAYAGIPKEMRADLHERFAHWLESSTPYDEIVGYHFEQAYRYRAELGPIDASGERLARRAAEVLSAAGEQAYARGDHAGAANLLTRVVDLLPRGDPLRLLSLPRLGESLFWLARYSEARSLSAEAIEDARRLGDRGIEWRALLVATRVETHAASPGALITTKEFERRAREALGVFEELGDVAGQASAGLHLGQALFWQFRDEAALRAYEEALACARLAGDKGLADMCAGFMTGPLREGPTPVEEAIERVEELLATASSRAVFLERVFLGSLATLYARRERFEEARQYVERARAHAEEFGAPVDVAMIAAFEAAAVERMAGNLEGAEAELRTGYEILVRLGESGGRSTAAVHLARVLVAANRTEEAEDFLCISDEAAASDDLATQVPLRLIRAKLQAERGQPDEAESLVREALALLEGTDDLEVRSDALLTLARVLGRTKKRPEGVAAVEEAIQLCERKGNIVLTREAQALLDEIGTVPRLPTSS